MLAGKTAMSSRIMPQAAIFLEKDGNKSKASPISRAPLTTTYEKEAREALFLYMTRD
jgi:hypothetical protein